MPCPLNFQGRHPNATAALLYVGAGEWLHWQQVPPRTFTIDEAAAQRRQQRAPLGWPGSSSCTGWLDGHLVAAERLLWQQAALAASCKAVVMATTDGEMAAALVPAANTTTITPAGNGSSRGSQAKATTCSKKKGGRR